MVKGGLTPKQEMFAQEVASGKSQADAYRTAYNVKQGTKPDSIHQRASSLMANVKIASRVNEIREPVVKKAQITLETHLERLNELSVAAEEAGQFGPAISAEISRGKASGLYTEKVDMTANVTTSGVLRVPETPTESDWLVKNGQG